MPRALLAFVWLALFTGCRTYIPEKVTTHGLLAITPGMTYEQVEELIGPPLCVAEVRDPSLTEGDKRSVAEITRCSLRARTTRSVPDRLRRVAELSLAYAEPRTHSPFFDPNIYVSFEAGRVTSVYIKDGGDGICCKDGLATSPFYGGGSREVLGRLIGR